MDQRKLDEKNLKVIVSGMKSKGYNTTEIKLNLVVTFAFVMLIFSIPYSFAANILGNENWKWIEMLLAVFVGVSLFLLLQYGMNRVMKCDLSLVKNLKDFKPIYKKHFIIKHIVNLIYCILLYSLGLLDQKEISGNMKKIMADKIK